MHRLIAILLTLLSVTAFAEQSAVYGPTTNVDQLWQIAIFVRPSAKVSVEQTMVALQRANPDAFTDKDINKLKKGVVLQVPLLTEIQKVSVKDSQTNNLQDKSVIIAHPMKPKQQINQRYLQQQINDLKLQLNNIGKVLLKFDSQYQARIAELEKHNRNLQAKLTKLKVDLNKLSVTDAKLIQSAKFSVTLTRYFGHLQRASLQRGFYIIIILVATLILLILGVINLYRRKKIVKRMEKTEPEDEAEYDFMGSPEGIPAKLDLARAYLDMDDKESARKILHEIIEYGDAQQREQASELLATCE